MRRLIALVALAGCKISSVTFVEDDDDVPPDGPIGDRHDITLRLFDDPSLSGSTHNGELVGFHDGDGPWQTATGDGGIYHLHVASEQFGVVVGCTSATFKEVSILERALDDGATIDFIRCITAPPLVHISGHVSGLAGTDYALIFGNGGAGYVLGSDNGDFTMTTAPGTTDLFVTHFTSPNNAVSLIRRTNLDLQEGSTVTFDIALEGQPIATNPFTTNDTSGSVQTLIKTPTAYFSTGASISAGTSPPTMYQVLPVGTLAADELYLVSFNGTNNRGAARITRGGPLELDVIDPIAPASATVATNASSLQVAISPAR
jgi:hypothetical protein